MKREGLFITEQVKNRGMEDKVLSNVNKCPEQPSCKWGIASQN